MKATQATSNGIDIIRSSLLYYALYIFVIINPEQEEVGDVREFLCS